MSAVSELSRDWKHNRSQSRYRHKSGQWEITPTGVYSDQIKGMSFHLYQKRGKDRYWIATTSLDSALAHCNNPAGGPK